MTQQGLNKLCTDKVIELRPPPLRDLHFGCSRGSGFRVEANSYPLIQECRNITYSKMKGPGPENDNLNLNPTPLPEDTIIQGWLDEDCSHRVGARRALTELRNHICDESVMKLPKPG